MERFEIIQGDALEKLRERPAGIAQVCVTSPPYFGLRDYKAQGQLGLEATVEQYVARLVEIMRGVKRVLRADGVLWLNLGDSYARNSGGDANTGASLITSNRAREAHARKPGEYYKPPAGFKPTDLMMIPARVAIALQADGWYLRAEVIWDKPNCMPESVTKRPTKSHESVYLLTKSRDYYFDYLAIAEPTITPEEEAESKWRGLREGTDKQSAGGVYHGGGSPDRLQWRSMRNARSVWRIPTTPYSGAHFATMPVELARRCVVSASREGDLVIDPFAGAGTTLLAALREGRRALGIELNPAYIPMALRRIESDPVAMQTRFELEAS